MIIYNATLHQKKLGITKEKSESWVGCQPRKGRVVISILREMIPTYDKVTGRHHCMCPGVCCLHISTLFSCDPSTPSFLNIIKSPIPSCLCWKHVDVIANSPHVDMYIIRHVEYQNPLWLLWHLNMQTGILAMLGQSGSDAQWPIWK